jgi:hypothetical protein
MNHVECWDVLGEILLILLFASVLRCIPIIRTNVIFVVVVPGVILSFKTIICCIAVKRQQIYDFEHFVLFWCHFSLLSRKALGFLMERIVP